MFYVPIPSKLFDVLEPNQGDKVVQTISHRDVLRGLFLDRRFDEQLGTFDSLDLKRKLIDAHGGTWPEIGNREHETLKQVMTHLIVPGQFRENLNPAVARSPDVVDWFRAVCTAPTKDPTPKDALDRARKSGNGSATRP